MKNSDFKKFIEHKIERQKLPDLNSFLENISEDENIQLMQRRYNIALHSALAFFTVIIIGASFMYHSPSEIKIKEFCQQYDCEFKAKDQVFRLKKYLIKYKKFLKEEA